MSRSTDRPPPRAARRPAAPAAAPPAPAVAISAPTDPLEHAVGEAARLLEADGAIIYLLDETDGGLRFAFDAGITDGPGRDWARAIRLEVGVGMYGRAVATRQVGVTGDYAADQSFTHSPDTDRLVRELGMRAIVVAPLVAGGRVFGALGTFSARPNEYGAQQVALVRALADHAAAAYANALLIEELATSQAELADRAAAERALREIAIRLNEPQDPADIIQRTVDEAARLLRADGARIDLVDPDRRSLGWAYQSGGARPSPQVWPVDPEDSIEVGVSGRAVLEQRVVWTGDYLADDRFVHGTGPDAYVRATGLRSAMAAPLISEGRPFGSLTVYSKIADAWADDDAARLAALASQAAVAMATARRIEELDRSRADLARRVEAEQALREIAARLPMIHDPADLLQRVVDAAARLVRADGSVLDLLDREANVLRWAYDSGIRGLFSPGEVQDLWISVGVGATGIAVAEDRVVVAAGNPAEQFPPSEANDRFFEVTGFRAMIISPITGEDGPLGALEVYSTRPDAFDEADAALIRALADQAAVAIQNARLIEALDRSRQELERRADAEQTLREIAARVTALHDTDEVLGLVARESARLLGADGALISLMDVDRDVIWSASGDQLADVSRDLLSQIHREPDGGLSGLAIATGEPLISDDYLVDPRFAHTETRDAFVTRSGIRSALAAPLTGESGVVGAITLFSQRPSAFRTADLRTIEAFAHQAAIAIQNARHLEQLAESRTELARRADRERELREIAARITALHDTAEILDRVVGASVRLLGADGAHLTRLVDDGSALQPLVVAGGMDAETETWLKALRFPIGDGINGNAALTGAPYWTTDYLVDDRIPLEPSDVAVAERLGLRGMAAVPLRVPGGGIIGTLAVSYRAPHEFESESLALLQGLADQAAIALTNTDLYSRLEASEGRYRHLVDNSPDLIWAIDGDSRFTFLSDTCERLTGWRPDELLGQHFGAIVHESSSEVAEIDWTASMTGPTTEIRGRVNLLGRDGRPIPAEFIASSRLDAAGRFAGANGSVRDMTERDRLERDLRDSEARYRFMLENAPDVVFSTDEAGNFTFISDGIQAMTGHTPADLSGRHFASVVHDESTATALVHWDRAVADPSLVQQVLLELRRVDGTRVPVEVKATGLAGPDGRFLGLHGATRDISERVRLERDLRRQAVELAASDERAHLARELHDSVTQALFSMTLVSRTIELLLDRDPAAAREQIATLRDLQREALAEMRALIFELRPGNLEQNGLLAALRTHSGALQGRIGLPILVEAQVDERLPIDLENVLYRVAQEALHNVVKHAGARQIRIRFDRHGDRGVRLSIADDGRGFDPGKIPDGHLGIAGMRARAERIGATFEARSAPGAGTVIEVTVPAEVLDRHAGGPAEERTQEAIGGMT